MDLPKDLKVIVFDFDGTLHNLKVDWQVARQAIGTEQNERLDQAVERLKQSDPERIKALHDIEDKALSNDQLDPTTIQALVDLSKRYKLAVLSRNSGEAIRSFLQRHNVKLDYLAGREDVARLKPHPEGLKLIADHFEVKPQEILMVGDTFHDVEVAKNAGTRSAIIKNIRLDHQPEGADYYIETVDELIR